MDEPRAITVAPRQEFIFWTDFGKRPKIERSNLNGSERKIIIDTKIMWPNGISVSENKVFWIDANPGIRRIFSCNFDGSNRRDISRASSGFSITLSQMRIFWSNYDSSEIEEINRVSGEKTLVTERLKSKQIWNMKYLSPESQENGMILFTFLKIETFLTIILNRNV